jgi:hypothetical protein
MSAQFQSPEITEAMKTAARVAFRLEDEFHPFDWEERLALARDVREIAAEVEGRTQQLAEAVEFRLECEAFDFSDWDERLEVANLMRAVAAGLQTMEGGAS